ncbi:MAG: hypothetical protein HGA38_04220 [Candidatus Moranbacteria bacterium]|nr:hypothetical protein [Candidatus Moranbacteria bacterium]NTW45831.1 hypothetical protein [Candidatus Moranbacteria bacterium]
MSSSLFEALFGSKARARLLRLFLLNPEAEFTGSDIVTKTLVPKAEVSKELLRLKKMGFVRESSRRRVKSYQMRPDFPFFPELRSLVLKSNVGVSHKMFQKLRTAGEVKIVLVSGLFLNYPKSKADMILVINNAHRLRLKTAMEKLEAEIGREIRFVLMDTDELHYRLNMLDRFLIEFLEGPYQEVQNRVPELKRFVAGLKK